MAASAHWLLANALVITAALAQDDAPGAAGLASIIYSSSSAASRTGSSTASATADAAQTLSPTSTDTDDSDNDMNSGSGGLVNYYFVFLALILCVAGLGGLLIYRRKKRIQMIHQASRHNALAQDLHAYPGRGRRRHWQGRWRSAQVSREEGLNEEGEAPPPYIHKAHEDGATHTDQTMPAIPLQALSREQAGLKPPEYTATSVRAVLEPSSSSGASSAAEPHRTDIER